MDQVEQFQITSNVLSGLTHIDGDFVAQPDLASDWSVSDDGTEYTFHLREGVTFHNGDPLTADDVVFTYNRSKDPAQSFHSQVLVNVSGRRGGRPADRALQARPAAGLVPGQDHRARQRPCAHHRQPPRAGRARRGAVRPDAGRHRPVPRRRAQPRPAGGAGGVRELLRSGAAQARARDRPADRRGRAAGGSAGGGRHPDHRRRAGAGRADRALPVQPRRRRRHGAASGLLRHLHEPLARADAGRGLQQAARGAAAGAGFSGARSARPRARSRPLHRDRQSRLRRAVVRLGQPGAGRHVRSGDRREEPAALPARIRRASCWRRPATRAARASGRWC